MNRPLLAYVLLFLTAVAPAWSQAEENLACDMPSDLTTPSAPMPRVAAALAKKGGLNILALGSGSTVGESGGSGGPGLAYRSPERSFPYQMAAALRAMRPGFHFNLTVQGGRNMTADMMLPILRE
ncbi:MAG TPA: hypothetical protein VGF36_15150, partial [Rhodopila sp.]